MKATIFYLAYGSNMHPNRMRNRCPGATALGCARLPHYRLTERRYADIDFDERESVYGVLYLISKQNLHSLDRYEGHPTIYHRELLEVEFQGETYKALTYEMSEETKAEREGMPYPDDYREMCSAGARFHNVPNQFIKERKSSE